MSTANHRCIRNGEAAALSDIPFLPFEAFRRRLIESILEGARISALPVWEPAPHQPLRIAAVLTHPTTGDIRLSVSEIPSFYPALTPECPAAHWFERELAETWRVHPQGHPWLKPIRFAPVRGSEALQSAPPVGVTDFFRIEGQEIHEVAVGPVHAGVIEPGHFRFQCHGETVHHLEISLGYQHRGIEKALIQGPHPRSLHQIEAAAGDTTIGHTDAYSRTIEALSGGCAPARAESIRAIAAELERIANHIGDLGALAGDVGFLPTMSYCGRIRGDVLNLTARICGNRFGRGLVMPGGTGWDLDRGQADHLRELLEAIEQDATVAIDLLFDTPSVVARLEGTGCVTPDIASGIGLVGVAARACGLDVDVRRDFAYGMYRFSQIIPSTWPSGDCFARAYVRWQEIRESFDFLRTHLHELPSGPVQQVLGPLQPDMLAVSLTEGWRGEICHTAVTGPRGTLACYKIVDPSFHNWFGLALALRNQQISDFPLCNKSFNLSYCGHDL